MINLKKEELHTSASEPVETETKTCPFCTEMIRKAAIKCRFCGEFLSEEPATGQPCNAEAGAEADGGIEEPEELSYEEDAAETEQESENDQTLGEAVYHLFHETSQRIYDEQVFFAPDIPPDKLTNALEKYARNLSPDLVLVLVDDTVFGSAKDGMIITPDMLYAHEAFSNPKRIAMKNISRIHIKWGTLEINDADFFSFTRPSAQSMELLVQMIATYIELLTGKRPAGDPKRGLFAELGHSFMKGYRGN